MREITTYCVRVISFSYILRVINTRHSTWGELIELMSESFFINVCS